MTRDFEKVTPTNTEESQNILYSEVEEPICTLKRNNSPGSDGITAEMIQAAGEQLVLQRTGVDKTSNWLTTDMLSFPYRMLPKDAKQLFLNEINQENA